MKFLGYANMKKKIKFDEIWGYQNEGIPLKQGRQNSKVNHSPWTDEIFQNRQILYEKTKFDKISPSNDDAKIHTFYVCKLDISQFQDTQANMKKIKFDEKFVAPKWGSFKIQTFQPFKLDIWKFQNRQT